jgi:hypothetical protein
MIIYNKPLNAEFQTFAYTQDELITLVSTRPTTPENGKKFHVIIIIYLKNCRR